jgi:ribosomal protein S3AE
MRTEAESVLPDIYPFRKIEFWKTRILQVPIQHMKFYIIAFKCQGFYL